MADPFTCAVCSSSSTEVINSYKHRWYSCNDCGNVFRRRKEKYLLPLLLPRWLVGLVSRRAVDKLYPMREVIEDEARFYDYYRDVSAGSAEATKWEAELRRITDVLASHALDLRGKSVLDISGGPGFLVKSLEGIARRAVVTEYSPRAVEGMARNLKVDARKFDYQTDRLEDVVEGMFDAILIRYSINFCLDLPRFVRSLRRMTGPESFVYVSFVPPTLGCCLRWQYDEYTYNVLYQPETMARVFADEGFHLKARCPEGSYWYSSNRHWLYNVMDFFLPHYRFAARRRGKNINRELIQKHAVHLYLGSHPGETGAGTSPRNDS